MAVLRSRSPSGSGVRRHHQSSDEEAEAAPVVRRSRKTSKRTKLKEKIQRAFAKLQNMMEKGGYVDTEGDYSDDDKRSRKHGKGQRRYDDSLSHSRSCGRDHRQRFPTED